MSALFPVVVEGAETRRRGKTLVGPVSLTLDGQGTMVILGPNGAGKTTLLRLLHGTARLSRGRITWACGTEAARARQAFVFQQPILLRRSVRDNLAYPLIARGMARRRARAQVEGWAERVGLTPMLDRAAPALSGGEQQKLALARALVAEPEVLFLDEPCAALDGRATREIESILADVAAKGTRLIMSTHDLGQARRLADQVVFLLRGEIHERGAARPFFDAPQTEAAARFLNGDIVE